MEVRGETQTCQAQKPHSEHHSGKARGQLHPAAACTAAYQFWWHEGDRHKEVTQLSCCGEQAWWEAAGEGPGDPPPHSH